MTTAVPKLFVFSGLGVLPVVDLAGGDVFASLAFGAMFCGGSGLWSGGGEYDFLGRISGAGVLCRGGDVDKGLSSSLSAGWRPVTGRAEIIVFGLEDASTNEFWVVLDSMVGLAVMTLCPSRRTLWPTPNSDDKYFVLRMSWISLESTAVMLAGDVDSADVDGPPLNLSLESSFMVGLL